MVDNSHKYFGETEINEMFDCDPEILDGVIILDWYSLVKTCSTLQN